ncbi:MAG: (Fe-S)-binding protein [Planctomycetota bacterium]|jgi:Na+-translocating ferredoxin:NAD+ oxidoreductase RNF subunit RnfB
MAGVGAILYSSAVLGGVGLVFGGLIAIAHRWLHVWEDPRIDVVTGMLPGSNCGACGMAGCRNLAENLVSGEAKPALCTQMPADAIGDVASYLGVDTGTIVKRVARLLCAGGSDVARQDGAYVGLSTCSAASAVAGGGKACAWGCLGLADCQRVCEDDAIEMSAQGLPIVDPVACTACGKCVEVCPRLLFELMPVDARLIVQCRSALEGETAEAVCRVACTACGKCVQDAAPGLIELRDGLAVVDPARAAEADRQATSRCPTGAIAWVDIAQFETAPVEEVTRA